MTATGPEPIETLPQLRGKLQHALAIEFATVPAYLCGWWTVRDPRCPVAMMLQRVVIAEMRHMSIAANVLTALGGTPDVTAAVPRYPAYVPDIWREHTGFLRVDLLPFGGAFLDMGRSVERPAEPPAECGAELFDRFMGARFVAEPPEGAYLLGLCHPSIGAFYRALWEAAERLLPPGPLDDPRVDRQYTHFGADNITVCTRGDVVHLLRDIVDEGEGDGGRMWDENGDLAHYYTFDQIARARYYRPGDRPCEPGGERFPVPSGEMKVVPMTENPTLDKYGSGTPAHARAREFARFYTDMVANLAKGFDGTPDQVDTAIGQMHQMAALAHRVFACPAPHDPGRCAGPTFELL
ncbi:ferritin-like protein [Streptomyces capparidis]